MGVVVERLNCLDLMIRRFEGGFRGCDDGCSGSASWDSLIDGNCLTPHQAQLLGFLVEGSTSFFADRVRYTFMNLKWFSPFLYLHYQLISFFLNQTISKSSC